MRLHSAHLLLTIDLLGTAFFAAEGAVTAAGAHLDLLGILTLSFITALGGGIVRDLLIGAIPPASIRNWRYPTTAFIAGGATFLFHHSGFAPNTQALVVIDAAGLAFFAVAGATKAFESGLSPLLTVLMGGITGVGGGTIRDLLVNRVPAVLRTDVYASAALLGATVTVLLLVAKRSSRLASVAGILACFLLRIVAVHFHWNLPKG